MTVIGDWRSSGPSKRGRYTSGSDRYQLWRAGGGCRLIVPAHRVEEHWPRIVAHLESHRLPDDPPAAELALGLLDQAVGQILGWSPRSAAEAALVAEILAAPDDPAAWLVYADWLEERGDGRAEKIRAAAVTDRPLTTE